MFSAFAESRIELLREKKELITPRQGGATRCVCSLSFEISDVDKEACN